MEATLGGGADGAHAGLQACALALDPSIGFDECPDRNASCMHRTTQQRDETSRERPTDRPDELPIWRNTRPRGNPEPDRHDLERSVARMEAVLGR